MKHHLLRTCACAAALLLAAGVLQAQAADKAGDPKRLQQQLRAVEREKAQLTAKKAELEGQLKASQDSIADAMHKEEAATRRGAALARKLETLNAEKEALQAKLAETGQALDSERQKHAETEGRLAAALRQGEEQRREFAAEKLRLEGALSASRERNERMYKLGFELIDRYERDAGMWNEPFTGLKRAQIEKLAEQERDKFDKERLPYAPEVRAPTLVLPPAPSPESGAVGLGRNPAK